MFRWLIGLVTFCSSLYCLARCAKASARQAAQLGEAARSFEMVDGRGQKMVIKVMKRFGPGGEVK